MVTRRSLMAASAMLAVPRPALLGGEPVRKKPWPAWPVFNGDDERGLVSILRSGKWGRGNGTSVTKFEGEYAAYTGARFCLATSSGTSALIGTLGALGIGPGDEVIVPPYTFVATVNAVLIHRAKPVFVDSDLNTFQIDARKIEAAITPRTRAIMPVHLGGAAADLDTILELAKRRNLPVIEDAAQAHLGEWRGRKVGTLGLAGCFSFQASKNLNSGEGGAILTSDESFLERCFTFHNNGRSRQTAGPSFRYQSNGINLRLTEFQAAMLVSQLKRVEEQSKRREENAAQLTALLREIPGIVPQTVYEHCTRNAWHLYMFRVTGTVPRDTFVRAMRAEGIPCSAGYSPLNREPFMPADQAERCPVNDQLCREAVWLTQSMLLDTREGMEQIAEAARKVIRSAGALEKA